MHYLCCGGTLRPTGAKRASHQTPAQSRHPPGKTPRDEAGNCLLIPVIHCLPGQAPCLTLGSLPVIPEVCYSIFPAATAGSFLTRISSLLLGPPEALRTERLCSHSSCQALDAPPALLQPKTFGVFSPSSKRGLVASL